MRLGKVSYYGDFLVYPVVIASLAVFELSRVTSEQRVVWLTAMLFGVGCWTLVEYALHRLVLHHVPYIRDLHAAHHADQRALIGTPVWLSFPIVFGCIMLALWFVAGFTVGAGLTAGLMLGYLWYTSAHHVIHHWSVGQNSYASRLKRRHMLHHHIDSSGNFGVTTGFWDRVFGTDVVADQQRRVSAGRRTA